MKLILEVDGVVCMEDFYQQSVVAQHYHNIVVGQLFVYHHDTWDMRASG